MTFIDLAHDVYNGMPGFKLTDEEGNVTQYTAHVRTFMSHDESRPKFNGQAEFEITELHMQTSVGTYLDAPFHRFKDGRDISQLRLDELIREGICVDARGLSAWEAFPLARLPDVDMAGKAVLFCFGWDQYWGQDDYFAYPFLSVEVIEMLKARGAAIIGVDTVNIDDSRDVARPAHTILLREDILIVENLTNLDQLIDKDFRFFAMPIKIRGGAAMNIRAFAELV